MWQLLACPVCCHPKGALQCLQKVACRRQKVRACAGEEVLHAAAAGRPGILPPRGRAVVSLGRFPQTAKHACPRR